jgi:hypothetical protein
MYQQIVVSESSWVGAVGTEPRGLCHLLLQAFNRHRKIVGFDTFRGFISAGGMWT